MSTKRSPASATVRRATAVPETDPEQTVLLPPPHEDGHEAFTIPALPPLGKIRQYEAALWSPAAQAALAAQSAAHPTDIDELGPHHEPPTSTKLSSKSKAPARRSRRAA